MKSSVTALLRGFAALALISLVVLAGAQPVSPVERGKIMDAIKAKYKSLAGKPQKVRNAETVSFMRTFKEISTAAVSEDGNLCCVFRDHFPYSILLSVQQEPPKDEPVAALPILSSEDPAGSPGWGQTLLASTNPSFGLAQGGDANDLPESTQARVLTALGPAFGSAHTVIRSMLESHGYQVDPGYEATLDRLKIPNKPGFFYINCHGGMAYFDPGPGKPLVQRYCLSTGDVWSTKREKEVVDADLIKEGSVGVSDVVYDTKWVVMPVEQRVFMISETFMKKYWRFSRNSFVVISACNSNKLAVTVTGSNIHASLACLWDNFSSSAGDKGVLFVIDRMLGANVAEPQEAGWPQRPFDYVSVRRDMGRKNLMSHQVRVDGNKSTATLKFVPGFDNFGLLSPSIKFLSPVPYQRKLDLVGIFGQDPGQGNRSVTINNIAMVVDKWTPDKITLLLPNQSVHGEVKVIHQGRSSNSRWLSNWVGTINIAIQGPDSLALKAAFGVNLIGDPWSYRENAGDKPVYPMVWNLFSPIGSDCSWKAQGEEKNEDGTVHRRWDGGGTPAAWLDENMGTKHTFGVGCVGDSFQRLITFYPAIVDTFAYTESGTTDQVPVKLGDWLQGQTMFQAKYDQDFGILGDSLTIDDDPSRLSYGGANGFLKWTSMQCRDGMPKAAAR